MPPLFIELRYLRKPLVPSDGKWELSVIIPLESRFFLLWYSLITDEGLLATLQQYVLTSMVDHPAPELWVISIFFSSITVPPLLLELDYLWQIIISYHVNCQLFFIPPFESKFFSIFQFSQHWLRTSCQYSTVCNDFSGVLPIPWTLVSTHIFEEHNIATTFP